MSRRDKLLVENEAKNNLRPVGTGCNGNVPLPITVARTLPLQEFVPNGTSPCFHDIFSTNSPFLAGRRKTITVEIK
jgi:hypothetical protein